MTSQDQAAVISEWSRSWSFYKSNKVPLSPEDKVAVHVSELICKSDPETKSTDEDIEKRGLALKVLDRIDFQGRVPPEVCESLFRIGRHDKPINVILAIRCFESFYKSHSVDRNTVVEFLDCLVFSSQKHLKNAQIPNLMIFADQLFFALELSKSTKVLSPSLQTLINDVEITVKHLLETNVSTKSERSQKNHILYKLLVFLTDFPSEKRIYNIIDPVVSYLMAHVKDDSRDLLLKVYDRVSLVCEENTGFLNNGISFFVQSRFLDVRSFGIRCLLKILRQKSGFRRIKEETLGVIHNAVVSAIYQNTDCKTLLPLLESLYLLNKQYVFDSLLVSERAEFSDKVLLVVRDAVAFLGELFRTGQETEDVSGGSQSEVRGVVRTIVELLEDLIAFSHNVTQLTTEIPMFSSKVFSANGLKNLDTIFGVSLRIFGAKGLEGFVERFYRIFLYTDLGYFNFLIKKHSGEMIEATEHSESLFEVWNVYLENEVSAFSFSLHLFSRLVERLDTGNGAGKMSFRQKGLECIVSSKKLSVHQLEKVILSGDLIKGLDRDFGIIKLLFETIKPLYNSFTALPKILYEKTSHFLDVLRSKLRDDPHNEMYIDLALNIPLSITLMFQHFVKISYFIGEALKREGGVLKQGLDIFEASLDLVSAETLCLVPEETIGSIVDRLVYHSREGMFALAATQILSKLHTSMRIHLETPGKVIRKMYPKYGIFLKVGDSRVRCDHLIYGAVTMVRGKFLGNTSSRVYVSTKFIDTFRETFFNTYPHDAQVHAAYLLRGFLFNAFGWEDFEKEGIYEKAELRLGLILQSKQQLNPTRPTHKSSHYARIENQSNVDILKYHHYMYDSLMCIFKWEFRAFLIHVYNTLITFKIIQSYSPIQTEIFKVYFDYDFLVYGLCEAFSLYEVPECPVSQGIFGKNISGRSQEELPAEHLCSIDVLPHHIIELMVKIGTDIGLDQEKVLGCDIFDDIAGNLVSLAFFKEQRKQKASILGIASILQVCKESSIWVEEKLTSFLSSLLFCMEREEPVYRNLAFHALLRIVKRIVFVGDRRTGYDGEGQKTRKEVFEKILVEQLFTSLSSEYQNVRSVSLQGLRYYAKLKGLDTRSVVEAYARSFYEDINTKAIGYSLWGFLDCMLLMSDMFPEMKLDPQLLSFLSVSLCNKPGAFLEPETILLKVRGLFYVLMMKETEESIKSTLEHVCKYLAEPIGEHEEFLEYCREAAAKIKNTRAVSGFSNGLLRASFNRLKSERASALNSLNICLGVIRIFSTNFTDEMMGVCMGMLAEGSPEVCKKVIRILGHVPRMLDVEQMVLFFKGFIEDVDKDVAVLFENHNYLLEPFLAHIDNRNILWLCKGLMGSKRIKSLFVAQIPRIRQLLVREDYRLFVGVALFLSFLGYRFEQGELHYFISRYNSFYHAEYTDFLNMNFKNLGCEHINKIYKIMPTIVFSHEALSGFSLEQRVTGYTELAKRSMARNMVLHKIPISLAIRDDALFESLIETAGLDTTLDSDLSFSEMQYVFRHRPDPGIFRQLVLYNESPSRILGALKGVDLSPQEFGDTLLDMFSLETSYKVHLVILIPLLIEKPSLITHAVAPKVIDSIHRLFGTVSEKHKLIGGRLLFACYSSIPTHPSYSTLFTHLFNFCISTGDKELIEVYKKFGMEVGRDIDFEAAECRALSECLAHEMRGGRSQHMYKRAFSILCDWLGDSSFDPIYSEHIFHHNPDLCIHLLKSAQENPCTSYHLLTYLFEHKDETFARDIGHQFVLDVLNSLLESYIEAGSKKRTESQQGLSSFMLKRVIEKYTFDKDAGYLKFLGKAAAYIDDFYVFEEIIAVMSRTEVEDIDFLDTSLDTESFYNFVIYLFRNDRYSFLYEGLQECFIRGLESTIPYIRDELHQIFDESISRNKVERLRYLISFNWNMFDGNWVYTFLRLMMDEEISIETLKVYTTGNDAFYEDVYKKRDHGDEEVVLKSSYKFKNISTFKQAMLEFKPKDLKRLVLDVCFYNEKACLELLCGYLEALVKKQKGAWLSEFEQEFRGFALELDVNRRNSTIVSRMLSVFSYFLMDVRARHNAYFANFSGLEVAERNQIYRVVEGGNFYYGTFLGMFYETDLAIQEILLGNHKKAQKLLLKSNENFSKDNFSREESDFLREEWRKATRELSQWETIYEVSSCAKDHWFEAESYFVSRGTGPEFGSVVSKMEECYDRSVFEYINEPDEQRAGTLLYLGQRELSMSAMYTPRFREVLTKIQAVVEIGERTKSKTSGAWVKREPCYGSSMLEWAYFYGFRQSLLGGEGSNEMQHELARTLNRITEIAIARGNIDSARYYNAKVFSTKNIRPSDAFEKICNELRIYMKQGEREQGLKKARMVNISYFNDEQKSTILGFAGEFEEADTAYKNAIYVCPTNGTNWGMWGRFFERRLVPGEEADLKVVENIFICFLNAVVYTRKKNGFKKFMKCMKYFRYESMVNIGMYLRDNIDSIDFQVFSRFCSFFIEDVAENSGYCSETCLRKLGSHIPQTVLRLVKIQIDRLLSPALMNKKNEAVIEKLQGIISQSKFENSREQLDLMMITSFCKKRIVFTLEETTYALLDSIFSTAASQIEGKVSFFDLKKTIRRATDVIKTSNWNPKLLNDFLRDFSGETMSLVELGLKTYKWMNIIENILQTYITSREIDMGISNLARNLGDSKILMFGHHEYCSCANKIYIDHFRPASTFYINKQLLIRSLTIIGSDGREYVYAMMMAGSNHHGPGDKVVMLTEMIDMLLRERPEFFYTDFQFKKALNLTPDIDLVEITEPIIVFGELLDNHLFKTSRTSKKMFFEYLKTIESLSDKRMYPGLERMAEFVDIRDQGTQKVDGCNIYKGEREGTSLDGRVGENRAEEELVILNNNSFPTKEVRLKAFKKMLQIVGNDILAREFKDVYGDGHSYFLFKKKNIMSYTLVSTFFYAMSINQHHPSRIAVNVFSSTLTVSNVLPFTPGDNDYFRITQNITELYKEEGLEGVFVPFSQKFGMFMKKEEFIEEFVNVMFKRDYAEISKRIGHILDGGVKSLMNRSTDPENLCMRDVLWHPWF